MYVALLVFKENFEMIPYTSEETAIKEVEKHFDNLIKENNFDPQTDEGFVMESGEVGKPMKPVYSTNEVEKYSV